VFTGLQPGTYYDFYQRVAETATAKASAPSAKLSATTEGIFIGSASNDASAAGSSKEDSIITSGGFNAGGSSLGPYGQKGQFASISPLNGGEGNSVYTTVPSYKDADGKEIIVKMSGIADGKIGFFAPQDAHYTGKNNAKVFADIPAGHWSQSAVSFVTARELFAGTGNGNFSPNASMTRAMFAQVIANLEGSDLSGYTASSFGDVDIKTWYGKAVSWAADNGIVSGDGSKNFNPNDTITREQMAVMLVNYISYKEAALKGDSTAPFSDANQTSSWAAKAVSEMKRLGIVAGVGDNKYNPKAVASRAEVAQIFMNFINAYVK
jgi:hypothetical protein